VPIPHPSDRRRQRGGRRRDQRPVAPVIAKLERERRSADQGRLWPLIVEAFHPTAPRARRRGEQLLLAEPVVTVRASPGQHHISRSPAWSWWTLRNAPRGRLQRTCRSRSGRRHASTDKPPAAACAEAPPRGSISTRTRTEPASTIAERINSWRPAGASSL